MELFLVKLKEKMSEFCRSKRITQNDVAKATGISQAAVWKWFDTNSETPPNYKALHWLKINHGLSIDWLFDGGENAEINDMLKNEAWLNQMMESYSNMKKQVISLSDENNRLRSSLVKENEYNRKVSIVLFEKLGINLPHEKV